MFVAKMTERKQDLVPINSEVRVGYLSGMNIDLILKAAENEFGTKDIPERSFMRATIDEHKADIISFIRRMIPAALTGKLPEKDMMRKIGRYVKELIEHKIATASSWATPLAPSTVAKKGHTRPLIETYEMITSIKFKVN